MAKQAFDTDIVLSLTTGILLRNRGFGEMHRFAEFIAGHAIWTHEFGDRSLWDRLRDQVFDQHPQLRDADVFKKPETAVEQYLADYVSRATSRFGASLALEGGKSERTETPFDSLARIRGQF